MPEWQRFGQISASKTRVFLALGIQDFWTFNRKDQGLPEFLKNGDKCGVDGHAESEGVVECRGV